MGLEKVQRPVLEPGGILSLEEQLTGKVWINGEAVYLKAIDTGALPNATASNTPHGITDLDEVIAIVGAAKDPLGPLWVSMPNGNLRLNVDLTNVIVTAAGDQSAFTASVVIVEYTKTTG